MIALLPLQPSWPKEIPHSEVLPMKLLIISLFGILLLAALSSEKASSGSAKKEKKSYFFGGGDRFSDEDYIFMEMTEEDE